MSDIQDYDEVPLEYCCPITHKIMKNPYLMKDGFCYEKNNIDEYLDENDNESPITGQKISRIGQFNKSLLEKINAFLDFIKNKTINVFVSKLEGGHLCLKMHDNQTILQLKQEIKNKTNMDIEYQRLIYQGRNLSCDCSTLKNSGIQNDSTVHLVSRLRGV